jgi:hypothetical protein
MAVRSATSSDFRANTAGVLASVVGKDIVQIIIRGQEPRVILTQDYYLELVKSSNCAAKVSSCGTTHGAIKKGSEYGGLSTLPTAD